MTKDECKAKCQDMISTRLGAQPFLPMEYLSEIVDAVFEAAYSQGCLDGITEAMAESDKALLLVANALT